jgi:tetratricopeptide (TPR) repeat protein
MRAQRLSSIAVLCATALNGASVESTLVTGRKALQNQGIATAWRLAQSAIADAPESAAAREFSGEVLFRRGELEQAEAAFKLAVKLDPNFALAWWGLARIAACSSMQKTAGEFLQRAYSLDPKDRRIFRDWAMQLPWQRRADALEKYVAAGGLSLEENEREELHQRIQFDRAFGGRSTTVLASKYERTEIPLIPLVSDKTHMRAYGLEVSVKGAIWRLVLDTGASGIVIPRTLAEKAGVTRMSDATLRGFGDDSKQSGGYRGIAERVRIGSVEYRDALISVSNQDSVGTADGLIGSNVFSEFLVTLDFANKKLRLDPLAGYDPAAGQPSDRVVTPEMRHYTPVLRFGHLLLLTTRVSDAHAGLFVIDSGADRTLISYDLAAEVSKVKRDDRMRMKGMNGQVADLYQTGDLFLQFAGFRQKNLGITAYDTFDQSRRLGIEVSGFLGLPVLDLFTLTIDYRDGLVNFDRKEQ